LFYLHIHHRYVYYNCIIVAFVVVLEAVDVLVVAVVAFGVDFDIDFFIDILVVHILADFFCICINCLDSYFP
jgi:hypothetical protein